MSFEYWIALLEKKGFRFYPYFSHGTLTEISLHIFKHICLQDKIIVAVIVS